MSIIKCTTTCVREGMKKHMVEVKSERKRKQKQLIVLLKIRRKRIRMKIFDWCGFCKRHRILSDVMVFNTHYNFKYNL